MSDSKPASSIESNWSGMLAIDDTALAVTDTGGSGIPVVYLNGAYADQSHWRRVIAELGPSFRHVTYDERARGRSQRSKDYSFEACVRDLGAVLAARRVEMPVLVGWSYGAFVGVHWADRNPGCRGVVAVDGALPCGLTGEAGRARIRTLFRRMRLLLPLARPFGLAARMSADEHADVNIELNELAGSVAPVLERSKFPVRFVLASGGNLGGSADEMEGARATLDPILERNERVKVSAKVASNHSKILKKDYRAIADAIREVAALRRSGAEPS